MNYYNRIDLLISKHIIPLYVEYLLNKYNHNESIAEKYNLKLHNKELIPFIKNVYKISEVDIITLFFDRKTTNKILARFSCSRDNALKDLLYYYINFLINYLHDNSDYYYDASKIIYSIFYPRQKGEYKEPKVGNFKRLSTKIRHSYRKDYKKRKEKQTDTIESEFSIENPIDDTEQL